MPNFICVTCGVQYAATEQPPAACLICNDERQYVNWNSQQWTTLTALQRDYHNVLKEEEPGLTGIGSEPGFAIGQRALLIARAEGNLLWDCMTLIDDATVNAVQARGGIRALAISHPHFYSTMVEWSHAFGGVPVYLHAADRAHVMRPDPVLHFWEGETLAWGDDITLIRCGGHFAGSSVLHWAKGASGRGVLLTGDTIYVTADRRYVTFMYSYPNLIPLSAAAVQRIVNAVAPFDYEHIYSAWFGRTVTGAGKAALVRSAERYQRALAG